MDVIADVACLPSQLRFINSDHKHPALVGGLGVGKSSGIAKRCLMLLEKRHNQGVEAFIFVGSLTQSLANDTIVPEIIEHLDYYNIDYRWVASNDIRKFRIKFKGRKHTIKIVSMDKPATAFVGYNATDGILDEFDVLPEHKKKEVWKKALGRIRKKFFVKNSKGGYDLNEKGRKKTGVPTLALCTTPEYKGFTEYLCVRSEYEDENGNKLDKTRPTICEYIRGETSENPFLSDDYLDTLRLNLDPRRFRAYTLGYFENFQGDRVWEYFDREKHTNKLLVPMGTPVSGWDFGWNDFMYCFIATIQRDGEMRIIAEYQARKMLITDFIKHYKNMCREHDIYPVIDYCDPAGNAHDEKSGITNVIAMKANGLNPHTITSRVVEGIIIGNNLLSKDKIIVHPRCRKMIDMLENNSYPPEKNGVRNETPVHDVHESPSASLRYVCVNEFRSVGFLWKDERMRARN